MIPTWITDRRGNVYLNDLTKYVKGVLLVPPQNQNPLTVAVAPSATVPTFSPPILFQGGEDSVSEIFSLSGAFDAASNADAAARATVQITETTYRRQYMNRPILLNHVFGNNLQPFFLNETIMLESQANLQFQFFNSSTGGDYIWRMVMEARKYQASAFANQQVTKTLQMLRKRKTFVNPYWLTSNEPIVLPPTGAPVTAFFDNTRDYFLILKYIMAQVITTGVVGDTQEFFTFQLFDAKTDRPLMNQPVTLNTGCGTSRFPFVLPHSLLVEPRTSIRAQLRSLITDANVEVFFTFHGVGAYVAEENPYDQMTIDQPALTMPVHGAP